MGKRVSGVISMFSRCWPLAHCVKSTAFFTGQTNMLTISKGSLLFSQRRLIFSQGRIPNSEMILLATGHLPRVEFCREMAKKAKSKSKTAKQRVDDIVDELSDGEDDPTDEEDFMVSLKETPLSNFMTSQKSVNKSGKGSPLSLKYHDFVRIVDGEGLWTELQESVDQLKSFYVHHLNIRSSASLDLLLVELEGDKYPLHEIAAISKKDPKRLTIDASDFPQASQNIMKAIQESGLNLNPQQDGFKIFVPIPKVTKEYREKLAGGARKKLNESKEDLRAAQNKFQKRTVDRGEGRGVSSDDLRAATDIIKAVTDHFMVVSDQLLQSKTKELLGK